MKTVRFVYKYMHIIHKKGSLKGINVYTGAGERLLNDRGR